MTANSWKVLGVCVLLVLSGCAVLDDFSEVDDPIDDGVPSDSGLTDDSESTDTPAERETESPAAGELEVHAINVGQADATLLVGPEGDTMLIDSGDWRNDGQIVLDYLDAHGIERIDHLLTTHPHADHIGGHAAVIEHLETEGDGVGAVWDPGTVHTSQTYERYLDAIEEHDVDLFETRAGDEIPMAGVDVRVFNPPAETDSDEFHANSLTVRVEHGDQAFLFTGDAEKETESRLVDDYGDRLEADVVHAGHHGSRTSSTAGFLDTVSPDSVIISSDYDSQYGHPHEEVLDRLSERDIEAYWTAIHGTIVFVSDGDGITVKTQSNATTNPGALRDEPETDSDPTERVSESRRTTHARTGYAERPKVGA